MYCPVLISTAMKMPDKYQLRDMIGCAQSHFNRKYEWSMPIIEIGILIFIRIASIIIIIIAINNILVIVLLL